MSAQRTGCCNADNAIVSGIKAVIDRAGRIVVPKALREALGLRPGQPLEIRAGNGRLEIEIAATPMRLKKRGKRLVAIPEGALPRSPPSRSATRWNGYG
jgi:AbrB family looped-hinge helix DNA binding protein